MAVVIVPGTFAPLTGGATRFDIEAGRICDVIDTLERRFPGLGHQLARGPVAIDGRLHTHALYEPLAGSSVVQFVPRITAG